MLLPFIGFLGGCVVFAILGVVVLSALPGFRVTTANLLLFIAGAFTGASALGLMYGRVFAGEDDELKNTASVLGFFAALFLGAVAGGTTFTWCKSRLTRMIARK